MAPPTAPGLKDDSSSWDVFEPSNDTTHLPPPPAYTEYDTAPSIPAPSRHAGSPAPRNPSHPSHSPAFADIRSPPAPDIAEPYETGAIKTSEAERQLLGHVSPYVADFLAKFSSLRSASGPRRASSSPPYRADLYLVPEDALPTGEAWQLSGADYLQRSCDQLQLTRVAILATGADDEKRPRPECRDGSKWACGGLPRATFSYSEKQPSSWIDARTDGPASRSSGGGGSSQTTEALSGDLWWRNDSQAGWLAAWLGRELRRRSTTQPLSRRGVEGSPLDIGEEEEEEEDGTSCCPSCACHSPATTSTNDSRLRKAAVEGVDVSVRAEDMTFRRETDMGLWESRSGWTIIVSATTR